MFENFISNSSSQEQEPRTIFSNYIFEKLYAGNATLDDKQIKSIEESSIRGYRQALDIIFSNESLKSMCKGNRELSESITDNFLEFVTNTQKNIRSSKNPFLEEEKMLFDFKTTGKPSFSEKWETVKKFLEKAYKPREINVEFYNKEFSASLIEVTEEPAPTKKKRVSKKVKAKPPVQENPSFDIVKKNFEQKWEKELHEKKLRYEIQLIEMERMSFMKDFYEKIDEFKKIMMVFDDEMSGMLGRLWGMGKGKWERMNFDAIKKYSERLKNDKSLMELAETLGKMQSGETELINEEFINTRVKPEWVPERATKSDLIGVRESDDLSSMLVSEIALLADKSLENVFIKKFTDKKLQTFEYEGRTKIYVNEDFMDYRQKEVESEKGPFILCIDTSGSMNGSPEEVAKALTFAMTKIAIRDKRKCFMISFSEEIETLNLTDPDSALLDLIPFLSHSFNGGTDAEPALVESLRMLKTKDYKKADVIMVSDFVMSSFSSGLSLAIKSAKKNKTKFHSLVIDNSHNPKVISEFDTNWIYNPRKYPNVITLLKQQQQYD